MKSMNRQFGKLLRKGPEQNTNVSVILKEFEDADKMLAKIVEASKAWRDAWVSILSVQEATTAGFEELYNPILGTADGHGHEPVETPQDQLDRALKLKEAYTGLKNDLVDEVNMMDTRVIKPTTEAKECLQPIKKAIKKRENKRLDWERATDKVNNYKKKMSRSDRENAALAKSEQDLAVATDEFQAADDHLRQTLPPVIAAAFSLLPHILAVQIMIQNTLLAQYYTILHNYCQDTGFPSPPPPMEDVIATWSRDFKPIQQEVEGINSIARGKAIHQPMDGNRGRNGSTMTGLNIRNGLANRRGSHQVPSSQSASPHPESRVSRISSNNSIPVFSPAAGSSPEPEPHDYALADYRTPRSGPSADYFQRGAAQKKKPPPPPPKRIGSRPPALYAIALYDFDGQNQGDLKFNEGDQIKVLKKTDSTEDWWEGELRGTRGSFPANYCQIK